MLQLVKSLCKKAKDVNYCHWKSNIDIEIALDGDTDLDILIAKEDLGRLLDIFASLDIRELRSWYHQQYPGIRDYLGYDEKSMKFVHFHLHIKTVLGRSGLKELHLPLEKIILDNTRDYQGFKIVSPEIEMIIFLIRLSAKTTLISRTKQIIKKILRKPSNNANYNEFKYLIEQLDLKKMKDISADLDLGEDISSILLEIVSKKEYPTTKTLSKLYKALQPYRRFSFLEQYMVSVGKYIFSKYIDINRLKGKEMMTGGEEFALLGMDGAGKSTLMNNLYKNLSYKIRTKKVYMGSSDSSLVKNIYFVSALPFLAMGKIFKCEKFRFFGWYIIEIGYFFHRRSKYLRGRCALKRGSVVIYERFPVAGVSDYPFLTYDYHKKEFNFLQYKMIEWLKKRYKNTFMLPDNIFVLQVPLEKAIERKTDHGLELLKMKHDRFSKYIINNSNIVVLDSMQTIDDVAGSAFKYIWKKI